jgi:hypothetical protein
MLKPADIIEKKKTKASYYADIVRKNDANADATVKTLHSRK